MFCDSAVKPHNVYIPTTNHFNEIQDGLEGKIDKERGKVRASQSRYSVIVEAVLRMS